MTLVLGVLNVTPDSFSDGGDFAATDVAIARGFELARLGADFIDVGGESTRPGATRVAPDDELRRVLPVVRALAEGGIPVSIDTLRARTAEAAVAAGARLVNDVSGGESDPDMLRVVADSSAEIALGHWRGIPDVAHRRSDYRDVVREVRGALALRVAAAREAGIAAERIIVDPGLGFDKTSEQGWALLARLGELADPGTRVLVGASRKRMLGELLEALPAAGAAQDHAAAGAHAAAELGPRDRDLATAVVSALAARAGAWAVRVHDVPGTVQALAVERAWAFAEDRNEPGERS
ncbi:MULTISPECIES: dihydropteroate synthase [unclassified Leucobacter]|uniref:dihydropteroate synthase n=1 Tax=unclassified Leucobacter TaxID=2621730 RepID=UPI00165E5912|nr:MULTISPECIES: dihydropteroate synthase [unclassified Leucobacter]MBC9937390.1 dihydropteroate synthase [Leucobacter sp. cx-87]